MRPKEYTVYLEKVFRAGQDKDKREYLVPMTWGPPGIGKSSITREVVVEKLRWGFIDLRAVLLDPTDIRGYGFPLLDKKMTIWLTPSFLPNVERDGPVGVVFVDELVAAPTLTQNAFLQLFLDRAIGEYKLPEGWLLAAAGNPPMQGMGMHKLAHPMRNRFDHITLEPVLDDFIEWGIKHQINYDVIGFLKLKPDMLFTFDPRKDENAFATPRSWEMVSKLTGMLAGTNGIMSEAIRGAIGEGVGTEFMAFIKLKDEMPDIDAILEGKSNTVPKKPDVRYVTLTSVASRCTDKQVGNALKYSMHYDGEFAVLLYQLLIGRQREAVARAPEIHAWADKFKSVLV